MAKTSKKLRSKILLPILAGMAVVPCAFGLVACAHAITEEDLIERGFTNLVVYDYQGGKVSDAATTTIRVQDNSYLPEPGADKSGLTEPARAGYSFRDFCVAKFDADGNAVPDETKPWDFATDRSTEESLTLCARWWQNYSILLHYGDDYSLTHTIDVSRDKDGNPNDVAHTMFDIKDYTFLGYYTDDNEQNAIDIQSGIDASLYASAENGVVNLYGKSIAGNYYIINSALELSNITIGEYTNLYINADLDMNEVYAQEKTFAFPSSYGGKLIGNDHTISNLKLTQAPSNQNDWYFGIFKTVASEAVIQDLTFKNVTLDANLNNPIVSNYEVGLLAGLVRSGATLKNVNIDGGILNVNVMSGIDMGNVSVSNFIEFGGNSSTVTDCKASNVTVNVKQDD